MSVPNIPRSLKWTIADDPKQTLIILPAKQPADERDSHALLNRKIENTFNVCRKPWAIGRIGGARRAPIITLPDVPRVLFLVNEYS